MKRSNVVLQRILGLLAIGGALLLSPSESGAGRASGSAEMPRAATAITILDQNGKAVVANATPLATSQIFDVTVGPGGALMFAPDTLTIAVGDTVRWTWGSSFHSVSSGNSTSCAIDSQFCSPDDMNCPSGILSVMGTVYSHTFAQAGTYSYFCAAHCDRGMTGTITVTTPCTPPPPNMVAWWPAEGNARDIQGGSNGSLQGNITFVGGEVGQAFRLGGHGNTMGNGDRVLVGTAPNLQLQDFTIDAWIKRASATIVTNDPSPGSPGGTFFAYGSQGYGFAIDQPTGRLLLTQIQVSAVFSVGTITDTNYRHVAVTKQGSTVTFYIDGVAGAPVTYNPTFTFTTGAAIGARGDNNVLNAFFGDIDELEIFNRALTAQEVANIFNAGAAGKCKAPQPVTAVSRKTHSGAGSFDIDLNPNGIPGVESRNSTGGAYQMIVQFASPVTVTGATLLSGTGMVSSFSVSGRS